MAKVQVKLYGEVHQEDEYDTEAEAIAAADVIIAPARLLFGSWTYLSGSKQWVCSTCPIIVQITD